MALTFATMEPSPLSCLYTKRKLSAVPQTSLLMELIVYWPGVVSTNRCGLPRNHTAQRVDAVGGPVLLGGEFQLGLAVEGRFEVVVVERHRLLAAVDDLLLGERRVDVAYGRAVVLRGVAVEPGLVDAAAFLVRVAFHVVHDEVAGNRERPDKALVDGRAVGLDLVDAPGVGATAELDEPGEGIARVRLPSLVLGRAVSAASTAALSLPK